MRWILLTTLILLSGKAFSQNVTPSNQSNLSFDYNEFLSGVRYAYILISESEIEDIKNDPNSGNFYALSGVIDFFNEFGFEKVHWGLPSNIPQNIGSLCELVLVEPYWDVRNSSYVDIGVRLRSCRNDIFEFKSTKNIWVTGYTNITSSFRKRFTEMCGLSKPRFNSIYRLVLPSETTGWTESNLKEHFINKGNDAIEGIYENSFETKENPKYKLGVIKENDSYKVIYLSGATNYLDWEEGELKARLIQTATANLFKTEWLMGNKKVNTTPYLAFEEGLMNLIWPDRDKAVFIKLYPSTNTYSKKVSTSGSGFSITKDGYIITNYHVVSQGGDIKVRGINGDFAKALNAKIVIEDKNNDLTILKIDDPNFTSTPSIPFTISYKPADVGSAVFALGYPLRATMGDEIKLTNGIISSKSGFQGDITSYQITVPIQPGNSGGPLFDDKGNLIGIINAKHSDAENASYAIKSSYLLNLIESLSTPPNLQSINQLSGKSLTEQVKILSKYTYIIEVKPTN